MLADHAIHWEFGAEPGSGGFGANFELRGAGRKGCAGTAWARSAAPGARPADGAGHAPSQRWPARPADGAGHAPSQRWPARRAAAAPDRSHRTAPD